MEFQFSRRPLDDFAPCYRAADWSDLLAIRFVGVTLAAIFLP